MKVSRVMRSAGALRRVAATTAMVLAAGVVLAPPALAVATASIGDATVTEGNSASTDATFTVTLSEANSTSTTVTYETYGISATPGTDYTHTAGTVTFPAGDTSETVSVPVLGDILDEPDETFGVALTSISNGNFGSDTTGSGSILDDDPTPTISIADASVTEGNTGTKTLTATVSLSAPSSRYIAVDFATADGTATFSPGGDFHTTSGRLVFEPGDTTETITLTVVSDTQVEADETFVVNLTNPVNATVADAQGVITIVNDDTAGQPPPPPPAGSVPTISIGSAQVPEGNSGTVQTNVTVSLSAASDQYVTVDFATAPGTATFSGADYHQTSGRLAFAPGETSKSILITVVGDTSVEGDESFFVDLSAPTNATLSSSRGTVTIVNDDTAPTPPPPPPSGSTPQVSIGDAAVVEGDADETRIAVVLSLSQASNSNVAVSFATADGTALFSDADYWQTNGRVVFAPGQTSQSIIVTIVGDTRVEPNEAFYLDLSSPSGATLGRSRSTVTITDDDSSTTPPTSNMPAVSIGDVTVQEGDSGTVVATVTLTLSAPSTRPVGISLTTVDGSATFDEADYWRTSGTLVFQAGETTRTLELTINGDTEVEGTEAFFVDLSSPQNATIDKARGVITIVDDESPTSTRTTLRVVKRPRSLTAEGQVVPPQPGERMRVVLRKRKSGRFVMIGSERPVLGEALDVDGDGIFESSYEARFRRPRRGVCLIKAVFPGNASHDRSAARLRFRC